MEQKDRKALKDYFKKGCIPTESQFADLIDSIPNIIDDGQVKLTDDGWTFCPLDGRSLQLSFFDGRKSTAVWSLKLNADNGLELRNQTGKLIASFDQDKTEEGSDEPAPQPAQIDPVEPAKEASDEYQILPADKNWHDVLCVTSDDKSFGACQIIASLSGSGNGNLKSTIINVCHHGVNYYSLDASRKHWWGWSGELKFRWDVLGDKLRLQVRSKGRHRARQIFLRII